MKGAALLALAALVGAVLIAILVASSLSETGSGLYTP